jgi:hypothetical protein
MSSLMRRLAADLRRTMTMLLVPAVLGTVLTAPAGAATTYAVGPISDLTIPCSMQNAEVEQAVDPRTGYVYEDWMGCNGIGFARSTDGGRTFSAPITLPGSPASTYNSWDPSIAVGPDGTVYAAFMIGHGGQWYPVVDASSDHGLTFSQSTPLIPPDAKNWGDRDFIAVGPDGAVYLTYDYGPSRSDVTFLCSSSGSCGYSTGDVNVVLQKSSDGGRTFGPMTYVSPGYPASGGDSAPLVVEPNGRIDVLYQDYPITNTTTYAMAPGTEEFTSSTDGGATWSTPVQVGRTAGTMSLSEWWIDGDIAADSAGNLYATWDTQGTNADGTANDIGWLSYSVNHGRTWSAPIRAPADTVNAPHIVEVTGGAAGIAYVGWLSDANPLGYAQYLRAFSITQGWLSAPVQISTQYGDPSVWPGDTFGISTLSPNQVVLSWGGATAQSGKKSDIYAAAVGVTLP